jgi:septal ring factor EnvC (AmiA/AmiB activator)
MRTVVLAVMLAGAMMLNVATVAIGSVATMMASAVEAVLGVTSVMTQQKEEAANLGRRVQQLEGDVKVAKADLDASSKKVRQLEGDVKVAKADLDASTKRVMQLEGEAKVTYRGQRKLLGEAVEDTTRRVANRTAAGATRNLAATFGEAVPVIGIGVVVAATVWELKDACDTMKDLQALEVALDPTKALADDVSEVCGLQVPTKEEIWAKVKASPGEAWQMAKDAMPELPEMPTIDWTPWN